MASSKFAFSLLFNLPRLIISLISLSVLPANSAIFFSNSICFSKFVLALSIAFDCLSRDEFNLSFARVAPSEAPINSIILPINIPIPTTKAPIPVDTKAILKAFIAPVDVPTAKA